MEHAVLEREELSMTIEGGKSAGQNKTGRLYTVADIEGLPEGERAGIYEELFLDFSELE